MAYEFINYEKKGRIAYITINRPERLNALHPPANLEMKEAFTAFENDPVSYTHLTLPTIYSE